MKLAIVISSNDPETVFNALRLANLGVQKGDRVGVFLIGKGVELESIGDERFRVPDEARKFQDSGGQFMACGTCLDLRASSGSALCPVSTLNDLYDLLQEADKVVSF